RWATISFVVHDMKPVFGRARQLIESQLCRIQFPRATSEQFRPLRQKFKDVVDPTHRLILTVCIYLKTQPAAPTVRRGESSPLDSLASVHFAEAGFGATASSW